MAEHRGGSGNFAEDREKASDAGRKGGQHSGGNFKNDPQRASGNDSNLLIVFYVQIMPDDFVMQLHRF